MKKTVFVLNNKSERDQMKSFLLGKETFGDTIECVCNSDFDELKFLGWEIIVDVFSKKDAIVLDLAGNHARHGLASKITREEMAPDYPDPKKGTAPTRECPECSFVCRACDRECPECGHQFPIHEKKKPELKGDLVEIDCGVLMSTNPKMKKAYGDFVRDAMRKNHSPHMPRFRFKENFGRYPNKGEMFQAAFSGHPQYMGAYLAYLKTQARLKNKDEKWVQSFLKMEFGTLKVKETA